MKKIITVFLTHFRNEAHYEFMTHFQALLLQFSVVMAIVGVLYNTFEALIEQERDLLNLQRKSDYTAQIALADHRVDRSVGAMKEIIALSRRHFDPAVAAAAQSLYNRFEAFGKIQQKAYEEETAAVTLLIADLNSSEYAPKITLLGLNAWLAELTAAELVFTQLLAARNAETGRRPEGNLKEVRRKIDVIYHQMADLINASSLTAPSPDTEDFITALNVDIHYFNEHDHQRAKKDLGVSDHTIIDPISAQVVTGKPITVVPVVFYRERDPEGQEKVTELSLGKDFSVTYRNNTHVGMAELTVHGKGAYRGQRTTTFYIVRG